MYRSEDVPLSKYMPRSLIVSCYVITLLGIALWINAMVASSISVLNGCSKVASTTLSIVSLSVICTISCDLVTYRYISSKLKQLDDVNNDIDTHYEPWYKQPFYW